MSAPPPLSGTPVVIFGLFTALLGLVSFHYPQQLERVSSGLRLRPKPLNSWGLFTGRASGAAFVGAGVGFVLGAILAPAWTILLAIFLGFVSAGAGLWYSLITDTLV